MRVFISALAVTILLGSLPLLAGCDALAGLAGLDEIHVDPGSAGQVELEAQAVTRASDVVVLDVDVPSNVSIESIQLPEGSIRFQASPTARLSASAPFDVDFWVLIDSVVALQGSAQIDPSTPDAPVSDLSFMFANAYDPDAICAQLTTDCPLSGEAVTKEQVRAAIDEALASGRFALDFYVKNQSDVEGTLTFDDLLFLLDY